MKRSYLVIIILVIIAAGAYVVVRNNSSKESGNTAGNSQSTSGSSTSSNSSGASGTSEASQANTVEIKDMAFTPAKLTVKKGTKVTWANNDDTTHTVTSDSGKTMDSGSLDRGESYSVSFDTPGTYGYHCSFHTSMTGTVVVTE